MKVKFNENKEVVERVKEGLKRTGGYCPCRLKRTEENKTATTTFIMMERNTAPLMETAYGNSTIVVTAWIASQGSEYPHTAHTEIKVEAVKARTTNTALEIAAINLATIV